MAVRETNMALSTVTAEGLRSVLGDVIDNALRGKDTLITRRGRPAVVIVDYEKYEILQQMRRMIEADKHFDAMRAGDYVDYEDVKDKMAALHASSSQPTGN
jgi:prevent-host-death family protein